jgi:DNA polymerase-3 subunit alpha (Gram-positive type)
LIKEIYITAKGLGGRFHPLFIRGKHDYNKPDQHLRSTTQMLEEFEQIFDKDIAYKLVVTNSRDISGLITNIKPLKEDLYPPVIDGSREEFLDLVKKNTIKLYGDNPIPEITERIEREVKSITEHGFDIVYYLSSLAVRKSLKDGYIVGSRGSVGSSIVATLTDITEVNPLMPHYRCSNCKYTSFEEGVSSGFDLENKNCPECGNLLIGDGHLIPFETFLGFNGEKVPDIDLNFSGEYQPVIHSYIKDLLGAKNVYRAGTISTVAERTAYGYVLNYYETMGIELPSKSTIEYLASRVSGTKRTTGQPPGGLIVVPNNMTIEDFTPINYPGNDSDSN